MRHPAGITHTTSLSTTPRAGRERPSLFLRLIAWVLMATISTSSFAQAVGPMARGGYGQPSPPPGIPKIWKMEWFWKAW